jgi:hypothetical protein
MDWPPGAFQQQETEAQKRLASGFASGNCKISWLKADDRHPVKGTATVACNRPLLSPTKWMDHEFKPPPESRLSSWMRCQHSRIVEANTFRQSSRMNSNGIRRFTRFEAARK